MTIQNSNIFSGLNSAQLEAVKCVDGASLIIAGAGSGKTRVLTCRIANVINLGCDPSRILALTFTKKAASEMKERIGNLVGGRAARRIYMGTFHSVFIRFLRDYAHLLGFSKDFTIYDTSDSKSAIKNCIKELQLDDKVYKPNEVLSRISLAKNNLITSAGYINNATLVSQDVQNKKGQICNIYKLYSQKCKEASAMDFDDILLYTNILFRDFPNALKEVRERFSYIFVDEYQDTNSSQYLILKRLAEKHQNICVVGDDSQSIYAFRGAVVENILNFKKDYPTANVFKLEQNYRSTQTIVEAANSLISKNSNRLKKECFSEGNKGDKIELLTAQNDMEEGFMVVSSILNRIYQTKSPYSDFTILYRTNAQSRAIEEALRKRNIPYRIYAGHSFYDRAEVKDLLSYFRLVINNKDNEAFKRVINVPARGIGDTSIARLEECAKREGCSLFDAIFLDVNKLLPYGLRAATISKMTTFAKLILELSEKVTTADAYAMAVDITNISGYYLSLKSDNSIEGQSRLQNIDELLNSVKLYQDDEIDQRELLQEDGIEDVDMSVTLANYMENVTLLSDIDRGSDDEENSNKVTLMTIHSSKGLEFPYVYIVGMEENLFPTAGISEKDLQEERRLCYVAITRAQNGVTMSHARSRMKWGKHVNNPPSRFIREVGAKYFERDIEEDLYGNIFTQSGDYQEDNHSRTQFGFNRNRGNSTYSREYYGNRYEERKTAPQRTIKEEHFEPLKPQFSPKRAATENFVPDSNVDDVAAGMRIEHDRFGEGTIISVEDSGASKKIVVNFDGSGKKVLLLKFAKIRKI